MRNRTSWNQKDIQSRVAAAEPADLASMNAPEHANAQPSADEYVNGDPSQWAEDVAKPDWKSEYSNGQTKRDEIGMPEMHTAAVSLDTAKKKAAMAHKLAYRTLGKGASTKALSDQTFALMHLPTDKLVDAYNRMASEGQPLMAEEQQQMQVQAQMEGLQAQAQQCFAEGKFAEAQQCLAQLMDLQAQQQQQTPPPPVQAQQQEAPKEEQKPVQAQEQQTQEAPKEEPKEATVTLTESALATVIASAIRKAQQQSGQGQAQQQQAPVQAQQQPQAPAAQQQAPATQASDDELLQSMIGDLPPADMPMDLDPSWEEAGIEMDAPPMGIEEMAGDPDLESLFTAGDEAQAAIAAKGEAPVVAQQGQQAPAAQQQSGQQGKQANVRVASVIGTRPPQGVARINTAPSVPAKSKDTAELSKLWNSAPDVSSVFRLDDSSSPGLFGRRGIRKPTIKIKINVPLTLTRATNSCSLLLVNPPVISKKPPVVLLRTIL